MKIFIINLKRSPNRKKLMTQSLEALKSHPLYTQLDIQYYFFEATDYKTEEFLEYKKHLNPFRSFALHKRILANSEIACYASHYRLWQECVRLQEPIIVLEDDVSFEPFFLESLATIQASKFAYVRLRYLAIRQDTYSYKIGSLSLNESIKDSNIHSHSKDEANDFNTTLKDSLTFEFHYTLKTIFGTQGYYITPKAANAFIQFKEWDSPVDMQIDWVSRHKIDNIIIKPFPIKENEESQHTTILSDSGQYRETNDTKVQIPYTYRIFGPLYKVYTKLQRAFFKPFYTPPKLP